MSFEDWWDTPEGCRSTPDTYKGWESSCREAWEAGQLEMQQQLAAEQAYSAKLLGELESTRNGLIWWMDAFPLHVTEADHEEMAKLDQALALPHDDSALREWGARLLDAGRTKGREDGWSVNEQMEKLRSGDWKP